MLKRKLYEKLVEWKNNEQGKTALLIDGARRVGKSYLCEAFAKAEYENYNLDLFFLKLSVFYGVQLTARESLIILDEVQRFPRARQLIKYFVKDGRYDYIETGSLISLKRNAASCFGIYKFSRFF